jgi:cellulose synthase/poly-beta-1,6-N-acetylglucosamine synthase-like glycosyltransferase
MITASILFLSSVAFIAYVVVGYPLLIGVLARRAQPRTRKPAQLESVSVVIAVRNGAPWIRRKLDSILSAGYPPDLMEILVVSDGSDDGTDEIVKQFESKGVRLVRVPQGGKPAALTAAFPLVKGELLLLTDVRQEIELDSIARMVACFADPTVGVVSGDLLIRSGETSGETSIGLYWRYESWIRKQLSAIDSMLGATGPFYMIRRKLAVPVPQDTLLDDVYLPLKAFFGGYRLVLEASARAIDYPTTLETEFRRKVRTLAGNYQMMRLLPALLGSRNRMWFHYMSYKVGRLLLPFVLIVMFGSSFWLPFPFSIATLAAQVLFYLLALADLFVPESAAIKRISSPARTFVVLMIAAICALSIFFVPPRSLWTPTRTRASGLGVD